MAKPKEYKKLNKFENYDHEAVEELAEALNEMRELQFRISEIKELVKDNNELQPHVWMKADGEVLAIHKMEDDHLTNAMLHLIRHNRIIPKTMVHEANKRKIVVPRTIPIDWEETHALEDRRHMIDRGDF